MKIFPVFIPVLAVALFFTTQANAQTTQSKEVSELIKKKRAYNREYGYGFRIQLANGTETEIRKNNQQFSLLFPTIKTYILFETPDWKIQVGNYTTRLEADRALNMIQHKFRGAIVVPRS